MRRSSRYTLSWLVAGVVIAFAMWEPEAGAQAATPDAAIKEKAGALWREGRALRDQQNHPEACIKFRQSLTLLRAPGTLLNVGTCFVLENDPEQAYSVFEEVIEAAAAEQSARRAAFTEAAQREIAALQQQFAKVAIRFSPIPGLSIRVTDKSEGHARQVQLERANRLLLKPGSYELHATAASHEPFTRSFEAAAGVPLSLTIPQLERLLVAPSRPAAPPAPEPMPRSPAEEEERRPARVLPWVLTGAGAGVLSGGVVTGLIASKKENELENGCPDFSCPRGEPGWQEKIDDTKRLSILTDVLWGAGLASLGVGLGLLFFDDADGDDGAGAARVAAGCLGASCGMTLEGRF